MLSGALWFGESEFFSFLIFNGTLDTELYEERPLWIICIFYFLSGVKVMLPLASSRFLRKKLDMESVLVSVVKQACLKKLMVLSRIGSFVIGIALRGMAVLGL